LSLLGCARISEPAAVQGIKHVGKYEKKLAITAKKMKTPNTVPATIKPPKCLGKLSLGFRPLSDLHRHSMGVPR
jgi:hypothetical protein